jgi:C1A family cysteine protease
MFKSYMAQYNKNYVSLEEHNIRFQNFQMSVRKVEELNKQSKGIVYSINQHSDLSEDEWQSRFVMPTQVNRKPKVNEYNSKIITTYANSSIDWRDRGVITAVKDQSSCGSCWAFAGTEGMESAWIMAGHANDTLELSPQQLIDCDSQRSSGCKGGYLSGAYVYGQRVGLMSELDYPYVASNQDKCFLNTSKIVARMERFTAIYTEQDMMNYVASTGPVTVCLNATVENWRHYHSGVMSTDLCPSTYQVNHCLQVVGFSMDTKPNYWIVRNSWGSWWGDRGYLKLEMFKDTCGISNQVYWVSAV